MDSNVMLSQLGSFGMFQLFVFVISCIPVLNSGLTLMSTVFISATPDHRCFLNECDSNNKNLQDFKLNNTFSIPNQYKFCRRFSPIINNEVNNQSNKCIENWFSNETIENCISYVYDKREFHSTVVTEWDVVCDNSWKLPVSQSIFMIGVLFGNLFFGTYSDRRGRKALFKFAPLICFISSVLTAFAPNFIVFTILTAITASCIVGMSQASFIIGIEFIGEKYRVFCANFQEIVFSLGTMLLSLLAYYVRDWRTLQMVLCVPIAITLLYPWLFPESVRWQVSNGHINDAWITLRKAAKWNRVLLDNPACEESKTLSESSDSSQNCYDVKHYGVFDLFKYKTLRFWSLNLFILWTINSMIFYGLSFQASNLGSNTYLTLSAISAVDIPANTVVTIAMHYYGRKKVLFTFSLLAGLSCISTLFIPHSSALFTALAIFGKSNISASYTLLYVYTAEIFPTIIRSTGVGLCTTFSRVGGIIAPHLIELTFLGDKVPLVLCGILALVCCLISMNLPETHGKPLPETFEDVEALGRSMDISVDKTKLNSLLINNKVINEKTPLL